MNILIESMTKFEHEVKPWESYIIRCWRQEQDYGPERSKQSLEDSLKAINKMPKHFGQLEIAKALLEVERMNAVEVLDGRGNGVILYADWP